jgi:hypothetical protein
MYIPLWEDSQWYTIKPASDLAEDCQVWCGGDEKYKKIYVTCYMYMLHDTDTDMYIPLWEDSQWYTIKPASDLAEDCQVWCGGDEKYKKIYVTCYMYMLHDTDTDMYIPLWEDSQWYTIKPASDLAEDCQVWCGGDEKYKKIYVTCYMYMLHVTCYLLHV